MNLLGLICVLVLSLAFSNGQDTNTTCQVSHNATLDECLDSFVRKWDDIRKVKPQVDALIFPLVSMTQDDLRSICIRVEEAQVNCGPAVDKCTTNQVAKFVQQNFVYGCKESSLFDEQSDCLLSTINGQQQCLMLLKRNEAQPNACVQLGDFFKCIRDEVEKKCKTKGMAALVHAIDQFGCDVSKLDNKLDDQPNPENCLLPDWQAVTNCFQPLLSMWAEIRDNDSTLLETAFPVFKFERTDLAKMCEMVHGVRDQCSLQIQRCPGHQLPEFTNSILGLACGTQQATFFLSYDCIRRAISENTQCHPYTVGAWQPGHLREVCGRMPQYYKCLEKPITAKCSPDGVSVLAQSIRQYGCELNLESSQVLPPGSPRPETPATTTTAATTTIPVNTPGAPLPPAPLATGTETILDFAGAPSGPVAQPPGGIFAPQPPGQQFLHQSISQPLLTPPPPPLVPGPQEPLFNQPVISNGQQEPAKTGETISFSAPTTAAPTQAATTLQTPVTTTTTAAATTSSQQTTSTASSAPQGNGVVAPIPVDARLLELCDIPKRNQARKCLHPLFRRWVEVHTRMLTESHRQNLTFPIYHYSKREVVELCDQYASAFLQCPFSVFQECLRDDVVFLANAVLGYVCSPQNLNEFTRHYECISGVVRERNQCSDTVNGPLLIGREVAVRCPGVKEFYKCNKQTVEQKCTSIAAQVFRETVRQFGCELDN